MTEDAHPQPQLSVLDAVALIVGVVVGAGIFRTPSIVAANSGSETALLLLWILGGVLSLVGALCYAELATTYPHAGGDYHYLTRAFGRPLGFLLGWARLSVIQTGAIAMQAFLIGDYLSEIARLGPFSSSWYAGLVVLALTCTNVLGLRQGKWTQNILSGVIVLGLVLVCAVAFVFGPRPTGLPTATPSGLAASTAGLAMIFILLTYGGWNEAAYISAELRDGGRSLVRALVWSIGIITAIYLLANLAFLRGLGLERMAASEAIAADLMRVSLGEGGAQVVSMLIAVAALSTMNATIFTGARTNYALGQDFRPFRALGTWRPAANTPANALWVQGAVTLALILLGSFTRSGFATMVEYTAPVFWFFLLLVGLSLFVLRRNDREIERPFQVPLFPVLPLLFCAMCLYMLHSSLVYTGIGALVGVAVLVLGVPVFLLGRAKPPAETAAARSH